MNPLSFMVSALHTAPGSTAAAADVQPGDQASRKILKAARDFESVLLNSLLRSMQETFSGVPGENKEVGADDYSDIGTQALASALAASGGLGIARMIMKNLARTEGSGNPPTSPAPGMISRR